MMLLILAAVLHTTDPYGNVQYNKPGYTVDKSTGRIVQVDPYGNKQYQKPQYKVTPNGIYQTDSIGNIQYQKGALVPK